MTEQSKPSEKQIFEQLIEENVGEIRRYRNLVLALVACFGYFNNKRDYSCYLGSKFKNKSPDIVVKSQIPEKNDIIGDGKKGLPAPPLKKQDETWEQYLARPDVTTYTQYMLKEIESDITKYSEHLDTITDPHDFFMLCPTEKRTAIQLLEKYRKLDKKAIILSFDFSNDETKYVLRIMKEKGNFSDEDINNDFEFNNGISHRMHDYAELMSKYKLYLAEKEDYNAPIEWIMLIIWQYILPELAQTNRKEMIIAHLNDGLSIIDVSLKQVTDFIKDNYKLPTYQGQKDLISPSLVRAAMENFSLLTEVKIIEGEQTANPKYRITWKKLPTQNLLHDFVKKIKEKEFEKIAKERAAQPQNPANQKTIGDF